MHIEDQERIPLKGSSTTISAIDRVRNANSMSTRSPASPVCSSSASVASPPHLQESKDDDDVETTHYYYNSTEERYLSNQKRFNSILKEENQEDSSNSRSILSRLKILVYLGLMCLVLLVGLVAISAFFFVFRVVSTNHTPVKTSPAVKDPSPSPKFV